MIAKEENMLLENGCKNDENIFKATVIFLHIAITAIMMAFKKSEFLELRICSKEEIQETIFIKTGNTNILIDPPSSFNGYVIIGTFVVVRLISEYEWIEIDASEINGFVRKYKPKCWIR